YKLMVSTNFRFVGPATYTGSRLARDDAATDPKLYGMRSAVPLALGVGVGYDTRDNEFFPRSGSFHHVGVKTTYALPASTAIGYGEFGGIFAKYVPLNRTFVFAARGLVDAQFGHVPFYDMYAGGIFEVQPLPGGPEGVRGVPVGRYLG